MKRILVHLDASPRAAVRLAMAQRLAARHGAEVTAAYAVLPTAMATPWAGEGMVAASSVIAELDRAQRDRARAVFEQAAAQGTLHWAEAGTEPGWTMLQRALTADLLVLGQADDEDALVGPLPSGFVAGLVADSGRPALVVPRVGRYEALPRSVLLAWKPTRESARAIAASLPWLRAADQVHLASGPAERDAEIDQDAALLHWLQLQGVKAPVRRHGLAPGDVGEQLLSLAADTSAELLVMGCYGHSRTREWVLGGATRSVLRSMTLPVLMVH